MMIKKWGGVIIPLFLIPILIAGGFIWAAWDSNERLNREVHGAIINLDEPVTVAEVYTPLGRQLTAALIDTSRKENLHWELSSLENAKAGLASGKYAAMVVIPKEFSAQATSFSGDASGAVQATITVDTSPVAGIADAEVGRLIALAATTSLNDTITKGYLDQLYLGFNTMKDQYDELADGSQQLSEGTQKLVDGLVDASDGADQLADGANQAAAGVAKASSGADKLANGVSDFAGGVNKAAQGTAALATGTQDLANGLETISDKVKPMVAGVNQLADAADKLADGTQQYTAGVDRISDSVLPLTVFLRELAAGSQQTATAAAQLNAGLKQFVKGLDEIETNTALLDAVAQAAKGNAAAAECPAGIVSAGLCDQFKYALGEAAAAAAKQAVISTNKEISRQFKATDAHGNSLLSAAQQIEDATSQLTNEVSGVLPELELQMAVLTQLQGAGKDVSDGSKQLAAGIRQLANQLPELTGGIDQSVQGASRLSNGASQAADGLQKASSGGKTLTNGMNKFTQGLGTAAEGTQELANGMDDLATGLVEAAEKGPELSDGMQEMADGIAKGKDDIPSYSDAEREKLATAVAGPINTDGLDALANANLGWGSVLLVLALWLGSLASNLVLRTRGPALLSANGSTFALIWAELKNGITVVATQTAAVISIAELVLQFSFEQFLQLSGILILAGAAFELIHFALVKWLGSWGVFFSLAAAVIFSTIALTSATPAFFGVAQKAMPLAPVLDGIRAIAMNSDSVTTYLVGAAVWLLVAAVASCVFIVKSRATTLEKLLATSQS